MKQATLAILAAFALFACRDMPVGNEHVPPPAKKVELSRYLGSWYELYRYENRFEEGCTNVTATYGQLSDGKISVVNRCMKDGKEDVADGKAIVTNAPENTKLKVSFFGPFYFGDYWILDRADDYSWAIVGEPSGKYLWILSRSATLSTAQDKALLERVKSLGYDLTLLHKTRQ